MSKKEDSWSMVKECLEKKGISAIEVYDCIAEVCVNKGVKFVKI